MTNKRTATIEQLREFSKPFCGSGVTRINVSKMDRGNGGYRIHVLEDDEIGEVKDSAGKVLIEGHSILTTCFVLYASGEDNTIGFIEHSYGAFTRANAKHVEALLSLIGVEVLVTDDDIREEVEVAKKEETPA